MKKAMIDIIFCQECMYNAASLYGFSLNEWTQTCMKYAHGKVREVHKDSYMHIEIEVLEKKGYLITHENEENFIKIKPNGFYKIDDDLCLCCIDPTHEFYKRVLK